MLPILEAAAAVPATCLRLTFVSEFTTFLPPVLPAKLRGAFDGAMRSLAEGDVPTHYRERVERAIALLRPVGRSLALSSRKSPYPLHSTQYLLGVPWAPQLVGPEYACTFEVLLLGDAAGLWDVWAVAASALTVEDVPLTCCDCAMLVDGELCPFEDLAGDPMQAVGTIADYAGEHPADQCSGTVDSVRVHLLTPTCWDEPANYDPREQINLAQFLWSGFTRMSLVSGVAPTEHEQELRDAILPSQLRVTENRALSAVSAWRASKSQQGTNMRYGGLVGHFDIRRAVNRPREFGLPADLLDLLWLLQATHIGKEPAFGCGRMRVEVIA